MEEDEKVMQQGLLWIEAQKKVRYPIQPLRPLHADTDDVSVGGGRRYDYDVGEKMDDSVKKIENAAAVSRLM